MRFEDLKMGMEVVANERSNGEYSWTTKNKGFVGTVVEIDSSDNTFKVKTTQHEDSSRIGDTYWVEAEYFEAKGITISLKEEAKEELIPAVGDMVVLENGKVVLICKDYDDSDFRGAVMNDFITTDYFSTVSRLMEEIKDEYGTPVRIIKKSNIKVSEI